MYVCIVMSSIPKIPSCQRIHLSKSKANFSHFLYQTSMNNKYHTIYNLTSQVIWTFTCIILTITILSNLHITNHYRPPPLRMRSFAPFYSIPSSMKSLHFASYHLTERWGLWKVLTRVLFLISLVAINILIGFKAIIPIYSSLLLLALHL